MDKVNQEQTDSERLSEEERTRERVDEAGNRWKKVYFGGGTHFRNWLSQCLEIYGESNIETEEIDATGLQCYQESGEKMHRIWVRERPD